MDDRTLKALAQAERDWIINKRRELHRVPENGFEEFKTQKIIMDTLDEIGVSYTTERTWVIGLIKGAHPGETVALRAEMDALPLDGHSKLSRSS